jgi:excisionase family DNA binding protein
MANKDDQGSAKGTPTPRLSYKIKEAVQILGVSPVTVRRAIDRGLLKPYRAFRHTLISAKQLKKFVSR